MFQFFTFLLARFLFNTVVRFKELVLRQHVPPPGRSAQVRSIVYRRKGQELMPSSPRDFWCTHSHWEDVNVVRAPNVYLYTVDAECATFVECDMDVDLTKAHAFYYVAQVTHARRVIQLNLEDFHQMAREIGDPAPGLVLLYSTGRYMIDFAYTRSMAVKVQ